MPTPSLSASKNVSERESREKSKKAKKKKKKTLKQSTIGFLPKNKQTVLPTFVKQKDSDVKEKPQVPTLNSTALQGNLAKPTVTNKTAQSIDLKSVSIPKFANPKKSVPVTSISITPNSQSAVNGTSNVKCSSKSFLTKQTTIKIDSDDEKDEEIPLSALKKKLSPKKIPTLVQGKLPTNNILSTHSLTNHKIKFPNNSSLPKAAISTIRVKPIPKLPTTFKVIQNTNNKDILAKSIRLISSGSQTVLNTFPTTKAPTSFLQQAVTIPKGPIKPLITGSLSNAATMATKVASLPTQQPMKPVQFNIIQPKNLVIAIDMDPQQWKKLTPEQQKKIIEEKKIQAQQKYLAIAVKNAQNALQSTANLSQGIQTQNVILSPLKPPHMPVSLQRIASQPIKNIIQPKHQLPSTPVSSISLVTAPPTTNNFTDIIREKRYEPELGGLKPLPMPSRLNIPSEITSRSYGDILMLVQFISTFRKFLVTEDDLHVTTKSVLDGVCSRQESEIIAKILLYFLKVLLGNETFKIKGLKMELADLPLTEYTVSYLLEQFLKSHNEKKKKIKKAEEIAAAAAKMLEEDEKGMLGMDESQLGDDHDPFNSDFDDDDDVDAYGARKKKKKKKAKVKQPVKEMTLEEKLQSYSRFLEKKEFHAMYPKDKLQILTFLLHLINESEDITNYQDELLQEKAEAYKTLDRYRALKRQEKMAEYNKQLEEKKLTPDNTMKIDSFTTKMTNILASNKPINLSLSNTNVALNSDKFTKTTHNTVPTTSASSSHKSGAVNGDIAGKRGENKESKAEKSFMQRDTETGKKKDKETSGNTSATESSSNDCSKNTVQNTSKPDKNTDSSKTSEQKNVKKEDSPTSNGKLTETRIGNPEITETTTSENISSDMSNKCGNQNAEISSEPGNQKPEINSTTDTEKVKTFQKESDKITDIKPDPYAGMTQRQIQVVKQEAKRLEEEKNEKIKQKLAQEKEELKVLIGKFDAISNLCKSCVRHEPLGYDRFNRSYWLFPEGIYGLYVNSNGEWSVFDSMKKVEELITNLTILGIREEKLKRKLRLNYGQIKESIRKLNEENKSGASHPPIKFPIFKLPDNLNTNGNVQKTTNDDVKDNFETDKLVNNKGDTASNSQLKSPSQNTNETSENKVIDSKDTIVCIKKPTISDSKIDIDLSVTSNNKSNADSSIKLVNSNVNLTDTSSNKGTTTTNNTTLPEENGKKTPEKEQGPEKEEIKTHVQNTKENQDMPTSVEALKTDLFETSERLVQGNLGKLSDYDSWTAKLTSADSIEHLKEFVLSIHDSIYVKSLMYPFKGLDVAFSSEWRKAVEKAETMAKLHTMYGILENSISWEKSSESLRCKACRRKQGSRNSTAMVICDMCQNPYHMNCVRPPLTEIPQCIWRCPKCLPKEKTHRRTTNLEQGDQTDLVLPISEETVESDHEDLCHVCGGDGLVILCDTCPLSFHFECHDPPLRRAPKGAWSCYVCRQGNKKKRDEKKKLSLDNENEEESASSADSDTEEVEKKLANKKPSTKKMPVKESQSSTVATDKNKKYSKDKNCEENVSPHKTFSNSISESRNGRKRKQVNYYESGVGDFSDVKNTRQPKNANYDESIYNGNPVVPKNTRKRKMVDYNEGSEIDLKVQETDSDFEETSKKPRKKKPPKKSNKNDTKNITKSIVDKGNTDTGNDNSTDTKQNGESLKMVLKKKPSPRKKSNENNENENGESTSEEWESAESTVNSSLSLGNKRPRYAKDGVSNRRDSRLSSENSDTDFLNTNTSISTNTKTRSKSSTPARNVNGEGGTTKQRQTRNSRSSKRESNYELKACRTILMELKRQPDAGPFQNPVNRRELPGYHSIIERPMDFSTIMRKLEGVQYEDVLAFVEDVRLIFSNCHKYFKDSKSKAAESGVRLSKQFDSLLRQHLPGIS